MTDDSRKPSGKSNITTPSFPSTFPRPTPLSILSNSLPILSQKSIIRVRMEPTFPLLRLPENVVAHVLQIMDQNQLLIFSLVSSKTKRLVTSLGVEAREVGIAIFRSIRVLVRTTKFNLILDFYKDSNDQNAALSVDFTLPVAAYFDNEYTTIQSTTSFNFSNWLNHLKAVFCYTKPPNVYFREGCERFEVQLLKNAIGNAYALSVLNQLTNALSREVLRQFNSPSILTMGKNPFEDTCETQKLFIQNFEVFEFYDLCSLDDMLLVNSEIVHFYRPSTHKEFNRFVKHWIRGSNPRLQYMFLSTDNTNAVGKEVLLKGIHCVDVAEEEHQEISQKYRIDIAFHMVRIRREDGTPAVIAIKNFENVFVVYFIVSC